MVDAGTCFILLIVAGLVGYWFGCRWGVRSLASDVDGRLLFLAERYDAAVRDAGGVVYVGAAPESVLGRVYYWNGARCELETFAGNHGFLDGVRARSAFGGND